MLCRVEQCRRAGLVAAEAGHLGLPLGQQRVPQADVLVVGAQAGSGEQGGGADEDEVAAHLAVTLHRLRGGGGRAGCYYG